MVAVLIVRRLNLWKRRSRTLYVVGGKLHARTSEEIFEQLKLPDDGSEASHYTIGKGEGTRTLS
jgi:hypothetical protein